MRASAKLLLCGLACLVLLSGAIVRADSEDGVPSFKKSTKKEDKEFVSKVGEAIVKAARSGPKKIELDKYEYTTVKDKENRKILKMTVIWYGGITKKKFTSTIDVIIDASNKDKWEVLNIEYKDDNKISLASPNTKKIQELIKEFNK